MQIVIKDHQILATHDDAQALDGLYPGCVIVHRESATDGPVTRAEAGAAIKAIRRAALDKFPKRSPGVSEVYAENYLAATRYQAGDVTPLRNGLTPTDYLAGLAAEIGQSAAQFAAHVIAENRRLGPSAYEVEQRYLAASRTVQTCAEGEIEATVAAYADWCADVSGD